MSLSFFTSSRNSSRVRPEDGDVALAATFGITPIRDEFEINGYCY